MAKGRELHQIKKRERVNFPRKKKTADRRGGAAFPQKTGERERVCGDASSTRK